MYRTVDPQNAEHTGQLSVVYKVSFRPKHSTEFTALGRGYSSAELCIKKSYYTTIHYTY